MQDLGTFGGSNGQATGINHDGDVVGEADFPGDQVHDALLWRHGVKTDLGNLGLTSFAQAINSAGQVVGHSKINDGSFRAILWEDGGPMIDLNTLVSPGSGLVLTDGIYINDRGAIAGAGVLSNGDAHAYLLIPDGDCDDDCEGRIAASQTATLQSPAATERQIESPTEVINKVRNSLAQHYRFPGQRSAPRD
jgi:probable HAF family extracellular repeat protein